MGKVNTKQHIGNLLLSRGVISEKELSLAVQILEEEPAGVKPSAWTDSTPGPQPGPPRHYA